ncbi:HAD family hydrolase [Oecophyllibacter saccharovorans]|uniref:HAD family hydrolase n=1 Tax=Oecophyllibacter saccharovorans TaxID=2558360 RepID=UPI001167EA32|nr:HAD family hydrolase [Oecophyllibacter saccharovorans]TPW36619.1 HAD family hydrolase [Oecophyllibacter saccharovorans]
MTHDRTIIHPGAHTFRDPVLLIDYDGTMAATRPAITGALQAALQACGCHRLDPRAVAYFLAGGGTFFDFFHAHVPDATPQEDRKFITAYHQHYLVLNREETHLFPGVAQTLKTLFEAGYTLVSVSNKWEVALRECLQQFDVLRYFTAVVGSEIGAPRKPQATLWTERIAPLLPGVQARDCLAVGDTAADIEFGHNAGIPVCWARYGFGDAAQCEALKPQYSIADFPALLPIVRQITAAAHNAA